MEDKGSGSVVQGFFVAVDGRGFYLGGAVCCAKVCVAGRKWSGSVVGMQGLPCGGSRLRRMLSGRMGDAGGVDGPGGSIEGVFSKQAVSP